MFEFPRAAQPLIDCISVVFTRPPFKRFVALLAGAALYEPAPRSSVPAPEGRTDSCRSPIQSARRSEPRARAQGQDVPAMLDHP